MSKEKINTLSQELGPGVWVDANGHLHLSLPDILAHLEMPDTKKNREYAIKVLSEELRQLIPDVELKYRANPNDPPTPIE